MRVVWLDDDDEFLTLVSHLTAPWRQSGAEVLTTSDPLDALSTDLVDLLVTDLAMPGADGLSILEAARRRSVRTVVVSAFVGGELRTVAASEGAIAVWDKSDLVRAWPDGPEGLIA